MSSQPSTRVQQSGTGLSSSLSDTPLNRRIFVNLEQRGMYTGMPLIDLKQPLPTTAPDVFSNDYLSLTTNPALRSAVVASVSKMPNVMGSTGSRLHTGNTSLHTAMEEYLREYFQAPAALYLSSGFDGNMTFLGTVPGNEDIILFDELVHASARDGIKSSPVKPSLQIPFKHNSAADFEKTLAKVVQQFPCLKEGKERTVFVVVESLYSLDGDFCPVGDLLDAAGKYVHAKSMHFFVDEAHTTGAHGPQGRGYVAMLGLEHRVHSVLHTFGKGVAMAGAVLLSTPLIRQNMICNSRSFIFSTSLPMMALAGLRCSIDFIRSEDGQTTREKLYYNCAHFQTSLSALLSQTPSHILRALGPRSTPFTASLSPSLSPIFPLLSSRITSLQAYLRAHGHPALQFRFPAVAPKTDRIRVVVHAGNTEAELDGFVCLLKEWVRNEMGVLADAYVPGISTVEGDNKTKKNDQKKGGSIKRDSQVQSKL
jgi:8-amino-7-oxononanoate synthase